MKRKITKEEYEKLSDVLKAEYEEKSGSYIAKIEGDDEAVEALRIAKNNEKSEHNKTKQALADLQSQLDEMKNEGSRKRGDVEAIENSWKEKFTRRETELTGENNKLKNMLANSLVDSALTGLASEIIKPEAHRLFKKSMQERLITEFEGEKASLRILDADGKPSALGLEDLKKEILANKEYSTIVIASRASGGAAKPSNPAGSGTETNPNKPYSRMTPSELKALIDSKGEN